MTTFVTLRPDSQFFVLHADGVGEYAMRHHDGTRCLFVFTKEETVETFVELMERPEHKHYTAVSFDLLGFVGFLRDILPRTKLIAFDPPANCEFSPVQINDFLDSLGLPD